MFLVQSWKFSLVYGIAGKLPSPSYLLPATPGALSLIGAGGVVDDRVAMISTPAALHVAIMVLNSASVPSLESSL